jgi:hypothetical protein
MSKEIETLISNKKYKEALLVYEEMYELKLSTPDMKEKLKKIPIRFFPSYDLVEAVWNPQFIPPSYKGEVFQMEGTVLQVLPETGLLISPISDKYNNWYCTVATTEMLTNLVDDAYLRFIGIYRGTKSYTTIFGATKTVPWIEIIAIRRYR